MIHTYIASLVQYGLNTGMIEACDKTYITNAILEAMGMVEYVEATPREMPLEEILKGLLDYAVEKGICADDITSRDLFDTKLMGILTPMPREVRNTFAKLYAESPVKATDWYYKLSQDTDYILLDEPLNNLDMQHSVAMMQLIRRLADELNRTILLVIHDINFAAAYSDTTVALKDGQLVRHDTPASIMHPATLEQIFNTPVRVIEQANHPLAVYYR